jgi:hypothetical protein
MPLTKSGKTLRVGDVFATHSSRNVGEVLAKEPSSVSSDASVILYRYLSEAGTKRTAYTTVLHDEDYQVFR